MEDIKINERKSRFQFVVGIGVKAIEWGRIFLSINVTRTIRYLYGKRNNN